MASHPSQQRNQSHISKPQHKKLPRLPNNARITKRPLLRPAIPSPYSGDQNKKIVYVGAKIPFMSAVKHAEKLLHLVDKRLVQSATTLAKHGKGKGHGKRKRGAENDEILDIAEEVEHLRRREKKNGAAPVAAVEEVILRGTGKAIQKCLELGLWFQQREEYAVRLVTGSVGAIDDVEVDEADTAAVEGTDEVSDPEVLPGDDDAQAGANLDVGDGEKMNIDSNQPASGHLSANELGGTKRSSIEPKAVEKGHAEIPETRIRYTSSLEIRVSLR